MARVTMADVARAAGVSKQTVSRVVNAKLETSQETIRRVQEAIAQLGYKPNGIARSLATQQTLSLGLVVPNLSNPYFSEIAQGAEMAAWDKGYSMFLCNVLKDSAHEETALNAFEEKGVDGVILAKSRLSDKKLFPLLKGHRAAVLIHRTAPSDVAGTIRIDDALGAELAVKHLLSSGRQRTALLAGGLVSELSRGRRKGFAAALEAAGHPVRPEYIVPCSTILEGATQDARTLLSKHPEIDGLVCFNVVIAIAAVKACTMLGIRVPEDVAIVAYDDILLAEFVTPSLTTLRVDRFEIGANAVRMLLDRMNGHNKHMEIVMKPELVVRASAP